MGNLDFDVDNTEPVTMDFEPIPAGEYEVQITGSDVCATAAGTGLLLKLTMDVMSGEYAGRKVFEQLNIKNPSAKAEQIGRGILSALCRACGKMGIVEDSSDLHERPFKARVKIEPAVGEFKAKNKVTKYMALDEKNVAVKKEAVDYDSDPLPF